MTRICPFCKARLGMYDRFFCTSCGNTLPNELVVSVSQEKKIVKQEDVLPKVPVLSAFDKYKSIGEKLPVKKIFSGLLIFGVSFILLIVLFKYLVPASINSTNSAIFNLLSKKETQEITKKDGSKDSNLDTQANNPVPAINTSAAANKFSINTTCTFISGGLINSNLAKLVPYEVDLYMEAYDFSNFLDEMINSGIIDDKNIIDFYENEKSNLDNSLGFFVTKNSDKYTLGVVFSLKDALTTEELDETKNILVYENYVVMFSDEKDKTKIEEVIKGTEKNLILNPIYASARSLLSKEGKLFILPITKNGQGFLYQQLDKQLTDQTYLIINNFLDSKLDYAVVL